MRIQPLPLRFTLKHYPLNRYYVTIARSEVVWIQVKYPSQSCRGFYCILGERNSPEPGFLQIFRAGNYYKHKHDITPARIFWYAMQNHGYYGSASL
jgi:hypothetical protein